MERPIDSDLHPNLRRHLERVGIDDPNRAPSDDLWRAFLQRVSESCVTAEEQQRYLELALDGFTSEMEGVNHEQALQVDALNTILGALPLAILRTDCTWKVTFANAEVKSIIGVSPDEVVGRCLLHGFELRLDERPDSRLSESRIAVILESNRCFRCKDGRLVVGDRQTPIAFSLVALWIEDEFDGVVLSIEDTGHRAHHANTVHLARMDHELRTTLNAIIGYSELVIEELDERGIHDLKSDVQHIANASHHLLSVSRSDWS